jgi:hypothetical protein
MLKDYFKRILFGSRLEFLHSGSSDFSQRSIEYSDWITGNLIEMVDEFAARDCLADSVFVKNINRSFDTIYGEVFLKKWILEYLRGLFLVIDSVVTSSCGGGKLTLSDSPLNRYAVGKYYARFNLIPEISWTKPKSIIIKLLMIVFSVVGAVRLSLSAGIRFFGKIKYYKVLRGAVWGIAPNNATFLRDDFFVDGLMLNKDDILLYMRSVSSDSRSSIIFNEISSSRYAFVNMTTLPIRFSVFVTRIIPKYLASGLKILFSGIRADNFSLYAAAYNAFFLNAIPYEKLFSNYKVSTELGNEYYYYTHVAHAIVCKSHGVRYYLFHWSDHAVYENKLILSFLACDKMLLWGKEHIACAGGSSEMYKYTGYVFKDFIKQVTTNRAKYLSGMHINMKGGVAVFFDECFGGACKVTEEDYIDFFAGILRFSGIDKSNTIVIKPKESLEKVSVSAKNLERFNGILGELKNRGNVFVLDPLKWSFIEAIGVADLVISLSMSSSSTIAIICGIEGLYYNPAQYRHPFVELFKDSIVFNDIDKLLDTASRILRREESACDRIPGALLRDFDVYEDNRGINELRKILCGVAE